MSQINCFLPLDPSSHSPSGDLSPSKLGLGQQKTRKVKECSINTWNILQVNWKVVIVSRWGIKGAS